jgi:hypothetical protein
MDRNNDGDITDAGETMNIVVEVAITEAASTANPYGLFTFDWNQTNNPSGEFMRGSIAITNDSSTQVGMSMLAQGKDSTNEDVKQFLQGFSRAWRNDKYQDISTNEQLVETIEDQGVDFEGLGFKFVKQGGKGFIYEIKANGAIEFVNDPTTLLEIKNKSFDYIEVYGKNSVKEVQTLQKVVLDIINAAETVDDKIAAIEAMSIGQMGTLRRISYLRNVYKSNGPLVLEHVTSMAIIKEKTALSPVVPATRSNIKTINKTR